MIIITCFKARLRNLDCPMVATAFVVPFGLFFPIQQAGAYVKLRIVYMVCHFWFHNTKDGGKIEGIFTNIIGF